jgi:hypothetical protein
MINGKDLFKKKAADEINSPAAAVSIHGYRRTGVVLAVQTCISFSSSWKITSTVVSKTRAIRSASRVEGTNLPVSIELTACLDTPICLARSAWVQFFLALSTLMLFFILLVFTV